MRRRRAARRTAWWPPRRRCGGPRRDRRCASSRSASQAGQRRAAHVGHPLDLAGVRDRHDAREHRLVDAERGELVDEAHVVLGLEEELGHREVGDAQLVGQVPAVGRAVGRAGMHLADGRRRRRRSQPPRRRLRAARSRSGSRSASGWPSARRVAAEGEDVLDADLAVAVEERGDSSRVWPWHVRCGIGSMSVSVRIHSTTSPVR